MNISREQAATIPLAFLTAVLALFSEDSLNINKDPAHKKILIWGGSCMSSVSMIIRGGMLTPCSKRRTVRSTDCQVTWLGSCDGL